MRKLVENELENLLKIAIIKRVDCSTSLVSPIAAVPKPNKLDRVRMCVDLREANSAIRRERHIIPTLEEISLDLIGCTIFSKLGLNQRYHQIRFHKDSRHITTFTTHVGLFRYKRLNFSMSCAAAIFQKKVSDVLAGISGVRNISDDIYIYIIYILLYIYYIYMRKRPETT